MRPPPPTEDIAREDILGYIETIQEALIGNTPEQWAGAAIAARCIENACEVTRTSLILRRSKAPRLPLPYPFDMTGFAHDCLGIPSAS